jgi:hypothetical protein
MDCIASGGTLVAVLLLGGCGGGGGSSGPLSSGGPAPAPVIAQVSAASALAAGCGLAIGDPAAVPAENYTPDSAVQPQLAANPAAPAQLVGVWEQDRWNAVGTRAINAVVSNDGGLSWGAIAALPFSTCGTSAAPGSAYDRASDPSIAIGAGGVVFASALAFSAAGYLASGGTSAVLVTRSTDGGASWKPAIAKIADVGSGSGPYHFNDRDAIAADPNGSYVYLVWDRLTSDTATESIPTWFARSADSGATWDAAGVIFTPALAMQTFNNQPLVLPDGSVVVIFTLIDAIGGGHLDAIRSLDHGTTWPATPGAIASMASVGTANPIPGGPPIRDSFYMAQTAVDPVNSTLAAVWQESSFSGGLRDGIALSLSNDQGTTWSSPVQVNTATTVAAFDPAVHFGTGGRIAVTYYDFRDYLQGSTVLSTDLWLRESTDGGRSWTETRLFGPFDLNRAPPADQFGGYTGDALFLGDQQGLAWNGSAWTALFSATGTQGARVYSAVLP